MIHRKKKENTFQIGEKQNRAVKKRIKTADSHLFIVRIQLYTHWYYTKNLKKNPNFSKQKSILYA
jgi:hypothetical protein